LVPVLNDVHAAEEWRTRENRLEVTDCTVVEKRTKIRKVVGKATDDIESDDEELLGAHKIPKYC
jgi:hypothetical protein